MNEQAGNYIPGATRACAVVATNKEVRPGEQGFEGMWVVKGQDGKAALEPVVSMLNIPNSAILVPSVEDGRALLAHVKKDLMPDMTDYSGSNICVVHSEALLDVTNCSLMAQVLLFPVGYVSLADMEAIKISSDAMKVTEVPTVPETTGEETTSEAKIISIVPNDKTEG